MKRSLLTALIIFILVFFCNRLQHKTIRQIKNEISPELSAISAEMANKNYASARKLYDGYIKKWNEKQSALFMLFSHEEIDEIIRKNARLPTFFNDEGETEAFAVIGELNEVFSELEEKIRINFKNIF